jgi:hypothetical protein
MKLFSSENLAIFFNKFASIYPKSKAWNILSHTLLTSFVLSIPTLPIIVFLLILIFINNFIALPQEYTQYFGHISTIMFLFMGAIVVQVVLSTLFVFLLDSKYKATFGDYFFLRHTYKKSCDCPICTARRSRIVSTEAKSCDCPAVSNEVKIVVDGKNSS